MDIFGGIERLITEHGSASILKERLLLIADKYAALEKSLIHAQSETKDILSQKQTLELENIKLKEELRGLNEKLSESHGQRLEEIKEKILVLLSAQDETTEPSIAQNIGVSAQLAKFHLEELKASKLINAMVTMSAFGSAPPATWYIQQEGRKYLVTHGLLA